MATTLGFHGSSQLRSQLLVSSVMSHLSQRSCLSFAARVVSCCGRDRRPLLVAGLGGSSHFGNSVDEKPLARALEAVMDKELGQTHVLEGLSTGEESQRQELVDQLLSIDFGLFQRALLQIRAPETANPVRRASTASCDTTSRLGRLRHLVQQQEVQEAACEQRQRYRSLVVQGLAARCKWGGGCGGPCWGQATRLGSGGPPVKGMLELDLPGGARSLFQLQAERLLRVRELARAYSAVCN